MTDNREPLKVLPRAHHYFIIHFETNAELESLKYVIMEETLLCEKAKAKSSLLT